MERSPYPHHTSPLFAGLFPDAVLTAEMDPRDGDVTGLLPGERDCVVRAVEKRQREFAAGRQLARDLLSRFGFSDWALLKGADRAPIWPAGMVGSITHCDTWAAAAVARRQDVLGIGCDLEPDAPLPTGTERLILRPSESNAAGDDDALGRLVFCAKEAFYKAQYPVTGAQLGFQDAVVELSDAAPSFTVTVLVDAPPFGPLSRFEGRFRRADGYIATTVFIPR